MSDLDERIRTLNPAQRRRLEDLLLARLRGPGGSAPGAAGGAARSLLVPFGKPGGKPGRSGPALLCGHPVGGHVSCYAELARALGPAPALLAVQAQGLGGEAPPLTSIEEMAARALAEGRAFQADQPLLPVGWSFGGVIAYEMARQLRARGESVPLLVMIDTWSPFGLDGQADEYLDDAGALVWLGLSLYRGWIQDWRGLHGRLAACSGRPAMVETLHRTCQEAGVPGLASAELLGIMAAVFLANVAALLRYAPDPLPVPALFFRPTTPPVEIASGALAIGMGDDRRERFLAHVTDPVPGWRALLPDLEAVSVPGDHYSVLAPPQVLGLAATLRARLAERAPDWVAAPGDTGVDANPAREVAP